jgi:DNA-binding response OmpR family regulator
MSAPRVLVVDDEPQIVRGLKIILRSAGYAVEAAESKADALAMLASRPPDALVLDLVLPDGQGVDVCEEVRRTGGRHTTFGSTWPTFAPSSRRTRLGRNI